MQHSGFVTTVAHPTLGEIPQLQPAISLSDTPGAIAAPPPLLGQHSVEVLTEIGYSEAEIDSLVANRVVLVPEDSASPARETSVWSPA